MNKKALLRPSSFRQIMKEKAYYSKVLFSEVMPKIERITNQSRYGYHGLSHTQQVGLFGIESYVKWNGQVMNPNPDNRATFRCHPDGSVQHNLAWGLIDREGCPLTRFQYDQVCDFKGGLARVAKAGRWGYINNRGKQVVDCQYQKAEDFHNGKAVVTTFDGWQYMINKKGECTLNDGETLKL